MTSVLTIDASKYVGWSFFASADAKPKCRTWVAEGLWNSEDYTPYFLAFEGWLEEMLTVIDPDVFAFESPIVMPKREGRGSDENNVRRLIGIVSIAELVCGRRKRNGGKPDCYEVHNQTAKAFVGASSRKDKVDMITRMTALGFDVADQHQADACAVALVTYDQLGES